MVSLPRKCERCGNVMYHYAACERCPPEPSEIDRLRAVLAEANASVKRWEEIAEGQLVDLRKTSDALAEARKVVERFVGLYESGSYYFVPSVINPARAFLERTATPPPPQEAER